MTLYLQHNPLLITLFRSPKLSLYKDQIEAYLKDEQMRREAFYDLITEDSRTEFINGEMVVQSPAKDKHTDIRQNLTSLLNVYVRLNKLGIVRSETALVTLTRNDYLPDICFFGTEKAAEISENQMKYPPPDLVVEILSPSTARIDRGVKFEDYAAHGVTEYWLVDPTRQMVEQYVLQKDSFVSRAEAAVDKQITSDVIDGFVLPITALFDDTVYIETMGQLMQDV